MQFYFINMYYSVSIAQWCVNQGYLIFERMYEDKLSIRKIVINIIIIIAETFGYSNILKED